MKVVGNIARLVRAFRFEVLGDDGAPRLGFGARTVFAEDGYGLEYDSPEWTDDDTVSGVHLAGGHPVTADYAQASLWANAVGNHQALIRADASDNNDSASASLVADTNGPGNPTTTMEVKADDDGPVISALAMATDISGFSTDGAAIIVEVENPATLVTLARISLNATYFGNPGEIDIVADDIALTGAVAVVGAATVSGDLDIGGRATVDGDGVASLEHGTYNPALTNLNFGVGGFVDGYYQWIGGAHSGGRGILSISGLIEFGLVHTVSGNIIIGLPTGFRSTFASTDTRQRVGTVAMTIGGVNYYGSLFRSGFEAVGIIALRTDGAANDPLRQGQTLSNTIPATWDSDSAISWNATFPATRV